MSDLIQNILKYVQHSFMSDIEDIFVCFDNVEIVNFWFITSVFNSFDNFNVWGLVVFIVLYFLIYLLYQQSYRIFYSHGHK